MNSYFHEVGLWDIPIHPRFSLQSLVLLKTRATVTVDRARSKQGLKEARYMSPHPEDRGSTYERSEVRKDRW